MLTALDIETDTSPLTEDEKAAGYTARGLDPRITRITSIALYSDGGITSVFADSEEAILASTRYVLAELNPSILVTWNGAVFDLPFISDRAARHGIWLPLNLTPNPLIVPKYEPTPGHAGGYSATWGNAKHIDIAYVVRDSAKLRGVKWSLKPYAQSIGLDPVEVDREKMHLLTKAEETRYVASDAKVTHQIAERTLGFA